MDGITEFDIDEETEIVELWTTRNFSREVEPNCVMYTTVIKGLARAKDFDTALEVQPQFC